MRNYLFIGLMFLFVLDAQAQNKFENNILAFEKSDQSAPPNEKNLIVFTGSSSVVKWKTLNADFPNKNIINRGFGGSQTSDLIEFVDRVVNVYHPKQVFIYEGDNDLSSGKSVEQVFTDFKTLFDKIRNVDRKIRISIIGVKPSPSRRRLIPQQQQYNAKVSDFLKNKKNVDFIDVFNPMIIGKDQFEPKYYVADSLHMTAEGYEVWKKVIGRYVR